MINHGRTLLLNQKSGDLLQIGEEFIPPEFVPRTLPASLLVLREKIFGESPDRVMLNFRAYQLLQIVHGTELRDLLLDLDHRMTYVDRSGRMLPPDMSRFGVFFSDGDFNAELIGSPAMPDNVGKCSHSFLVTSDGTDFSVNGLSAAAGDVSPLGDTGWSVRMPSSVQAGSTTVTVVRRPQRSVIDVFDLLQGLSASVYDNLFLDNAQHFSTLREIWFSPFESVTYKLAAMVMAIILRTDALPESSGGGRPVVSNLPIIVTEPETVFVTDGDPTSFTVVAENADTYQWQVATDVEFSDLVGETSPTYNIASVSPSQGGNAYRCIVSNAYGPVLSRAAYLNVAASE